MLSAFVVRSREIYGTSTPSLIALQKNGPTPIGKSKSMSSRAITESSSCALGPATFGRQEQSPRPARREQHHEILICRRRSEERRVGKECRSRRSRYD